MSIDELNEYGKREIVNLAYKRQQFAQQQIEQQIGRSGIPRRFIGRSFDSYQVTAQEQQTALNICKHYGKNFDQILKSGYSLTLTGKPGTGKTHLACAILSAVIHGGHTGLFITVSEALRLIRATYSPKANRTETEAFELLIQPDLLVLDEVGVTIGDSAKRQALLFDIINGRYAEQRPTIFISNLSTSDLNEYLGERIMDRILEAGSACVSFTWSSYRRTDPQSTESNIGNMK